ncbi:hypothetical protein QTO02_05965 [Vibrio fortis]
MREHDTPNDHPSFDTPTRTPLTEEQLKARAKRIREENPQLATEWDENQPTQEDLENLAKWKTKRLKKNLLDRYPHLSYAEPTGKERTCYDSDIAL